MAVRERVAMTTADGSRRVVRGGMVIAGGGDWRPRRADISFAAGRITEIGPDLDGPTAFDATGMVIVPGFVNPHLHLGAYFYRFEADRRSLSSFIEFTDRFYANARGPETTMRDSTYLTLGESIAYGSTTVAVSKGWTEVAEFGLTGLCLYPVMRSRSLAPFLMNLREEFHAMADFCSDHDLAYGLFVPSLQHVDEELLAEVGELLRNDGQARVALHILESATERAEVMQRFGKPPITLLCDNGLLTRRTLLVHASHANVDEIQAVVDHGAHIVVCPTSNLRLRTGLPPVRSFRENAIPIAIGSDGPASGMSLGMLDHARLLGIAYADLDFDARDLFDMITCAPARALGLDHVVGSLEVGKLMNAVLFDQGQFFCSSDQVLEELVFGSPKQPRDVMLRGELVCKRGVLTSEVLRKVRLCVS